VHIRAAGTDEFNKLREFIDNDTQIRLEAMPERLYFQNQNRSSTFLKTAGTLIAVLLTFGAMFAAANTMFAAVSARTREIGTMRALGFSQFDVLICFLGESLILCGLGGAVGLLAAIPLNSFTFETANFNSFASMTISFRFGPLVMAAAMLMTVAMGVFGGMFPAIRAVRLNVISALREL
jgi:putative ABC transport system permease protein